MLRHVEQRIEAAVGSLPPEPQEGNTEYKLKLLSPTAERFQHLVTQMKWRLAEGAGEAIYQVRCFLWIWIWMAPQHAQLYA